MPVFSSQVQVEEAIVLSCLGYGGGRPIPAKVKTEIDFLMTRLPHMIQPQAIYEIYAITRTDDSITLPGNILLTGEYIGRGLAQADTVVAAVATLGETVSDEIDDCFAREKFLRGVLLDTMANIAMREFTKMFRQELLAKHAGTGRGVTAALHPGSGDWPIEAQTGLFRLVDGRRVGVVLNASTVMSPCKTVSMLFGMGEALPIKQPAAGCLDCSQTRCAYRQAKEEYPLTVRQGETSRTIQAGSQETILSALVRRGIAVSSPCGGNHTCGKCRISVVEPAFIPVAAEEAALLSEVEIRRGERLACCHTIKTAMTIEVPQPLPPGAIVVEGPAGQGKGKARISRKSISVPASSLANQQDDISRLRTALELPSAHFPLSVLQQIPALLAGKEQRLDCVLYREELLSAAVAGKNTRAYGAAIDIGTTTIVVHLADLLTGERVATDAFLNPQRLYGADVISRIEHAGRTEKGMDELRLPLVKELNDSLARLCAGQGIPPEHIYETVIAGNTAMLHLFWGIPCGGMGRAPYVPAVTAGLREKAGKAGLRMNQEGYVATLPSIAAFVGADITAGIIACGMHKTEKLTLLVDIGTNGEMVLGNRDRLLCCSTAAGSAFEGAKITCGMGSVAGAIDHVRFADEVLYSTIGGEKPAGICGSGLVDAIAELLRRRVITDKGRLLSRNAATADGPAWLLERLVDYKGKTAFLLDAPNNIVITQSDVRELQLAKGAIYAGISVLCAELGVGFDDIEEICLAGGFGSTLQVENVMTVGLLPRVSREKVKAVGNSAGAGALMVLLDETALSEAESVAKTVQYLELAGSRLFSEHFMKSMNFPEK